jgi:hypothetical protein
MKILALLCSIFLFNTVIYCQTKQADTSDKFLYKITVVTRGMVGGGCNVTINRTIYSDGRIEIEDCQNTKVAEDGKKIPVKVEKKIDQRTVNEFIQFVEESGFLEAKKTYRGKQTYTDIWVLTTIIYQNQNSEKKVEIINYDSYDLSIPCFLHMIHGKSLSLTF